MASIRTATVFMPWALRSRACSHFDIEGHRNTACSGQIFVLHPDEIHDGHAGSVSGFRYGSLYIEPRLIQVALAGGAGRRRWQEALGQPYRPLPYLRDAVSNDRRLVSAIEPALEDLDMPLDALHLDEIILNIGKVRAAIDSSAPRRPLATVHWRAVEAARDFFDTRAQRQGASEEL